MDPNVVINNLQKYFCQILHHPMNLEWGEYYIKYIFYLCQEKEYIPSIIHELYFNGNLSDEVLVNITMDYHYIRLNTNNKARPNPTYLDNEFIKLSRLNYLISDKIKEHEQRYGNIEISLGYKLGKLHSLIIKRLSEISAEKNNC